MYPEIARPFGISIPSYFASLAIGFALAILIVRRWAGKNGIDRAAIVDLGLEMVIAGVVGARILHVLADGYFWDYVHLCTDPSKVAWHVSKALCASPDVAGVWDAAARVCRPRASDCFAWAAFWNGGLTYYGGLLLAVPVGWRFLKRERMPVWKVSDIAAAVIPLGVFFGRIGCFLGGCCFGSRCDLAWAAHFPAWSPASESQFRAGLLRSEGFPAFPVHPTQLYEAIFSLALFAWLYFRVHPRKRYDGHVFVLFLFAYGVGRFAIEFWRRDDRGALAGLSTSQWIGVVLCLAAVALHVVMRRRVRAVAL